MDVSPPSYPKITSFERIVSVFEIAEVTFVHPKNWLTLLSVYEIILFPETKVPVFPNPIVESTVIIDDPIETESITFVFGVILNSPSVRLLSSYPMNSESL